MAQPISSSRSRDIKTNGKSLTIEKFAYDTMSTFKSVDYVQKDWCNATNDLYYILKDNPAITRGIQIKVLGNDKDKYAYRMAGCDKYPIGTLIVGICLDPAMAVIYTTSEEFNKSTPYVSLNPKSKVKFNQFLITDWQKFLIKFEESLIRGTVITAEVFKNSMSERYLAEYCCLKRLEYFCHIRGHTFEKVTDNSSVTDVIINGNKTQVKYRHDDGTVGGEHNHNYVLFIVAKSSGGKSKSSIPYEVGDNYLYVFESHFMPGVFLFLTEEQLVKEGLIKTPTQAGKTSFRVYTPDFYERNKGRKLNYNSKPNWTFNLDLWWCTEKGNLGDHRRLMEYNQNLIEYNKQLLEYNKLIESTKSLSI